MGKDSKMVTARDEHAEEESMSDVDYEALKGDEETDDDDDEAGDDETTEDGQSGDRVGDSEDAEDEEAACRENEELPGEGGGRNGFRNPHAGDTSDELDNDNMMSEAGSYPGALTLEEDIGEVLAGKVKRRRTLGKRDRQRARKSSWEDLLGMNDADWDDESDDDDWSPISALKLRPHWFCINCTMPNSENLQLCSKCGENVKSDILSRGHLSSPLDPARSPSSTEPTANHELSKDSSPGSLGTSSACSSDHTTETSKSGKTVLGFDERMLLHYETHMKSHPHPERPDRLRVIIAGLTAEGLYPGRCVSLPAREVTRSELEKVHSEAHVDAVEVTCNKDLSYFTTDTYANKDSSLAARLAAGICADLAKAIVHGEAQNGFALVRPPGHHAEEVNVMGFCLHNNAGVAAKAAQAAGAKKVLIVDWDVHHGNGTQDIFDDDPTVLYVSLHRHEGGTFYPGTGAATEVGVGNGEGSSVNIPWMCSGIGDNDYIYAFLHIVLPIAKQFAPDMTIISAGFDAARGDPLGGCEVTPSGYAHMTSLLSSLSGGKMLVVLEGGYNLRSISASATAVIKVLLGDNPGPLPDNLQPTEAGALSMFDVFAVQSQYWPCLQIPLFVQHLARISSRGHRKGKRINRKPYVGGPVWWKWGRRRVVYYLWQEAGFRRNKWLRTTR
ncbi:protein MpHDAC3 [Marchantia polymorpha subsp. ruderalis]|uniref:histone deacetylase n=2 Tax=Marchantia polymorpha TaxID=3197 RepID=A0AAF6AS54_MARPO|nr:hypothetical protein MARPO_0001s0348 [Marchantia polymorpha]BBM99274.1 hypothetical protein Mp_1g20110 [Marchantia polymorpha subsp. ruderalis]|eukprot:PTQ50358.1 hypothetical protein MARPO_0001s0348 [Marchantia polymorpha]